MRLLLLGLITGLSAFGAENVEILRDNFGTPHIYARTSAGAAYAAGYAQAEDRKDALLRNLREAGTEQDVSLSPPVRVIVAAFCAGINRYLSETSGSPEPPVTPAMVVAFSRRAFMTIHGSNDVLIGPARTTTGNVIAILDPLSGWNDDGRPYEMRWYASDEQIALSGVAPPGIPFPLVGHSAALAVGWSGSTETASPRALEEAWGMITARSLADVQAALRMGQIPGSALVGTQSEIFDSSGRTPEDGILLRQRTVPQSEMMTAQLLAAQNKWPLGRAVDIAFSTILYKAETWQARLAKVAPELPFVQTLTGWSRRSDATSMEALAFYLFKMALGKPEAAALEPPDSLSNNRIRAALRKAQDQVETELPYHADYGTMFRVARDGALRSTPAAGGTVTEAGMITPRAITFERRGAVVIGTGGQSATQIVELSRVPNAVSILVPGESDQPGSPHFDDQARDLFSKGIGKPTYFGDRKELEKHLSSKKELTF